MDRERHDELLSAYLDRELSPDERAALDRLLEGSPEARSRLQELTATSRFLRELPRHQLGPDFADGIIERLARESLLRPAEPVSRRTGRRVVWWAAGPLAAAAALVLAVWIGHRPRDDQSREVARLDTPPATSAALEVAELPDADALDMFAKREAEDQVRPGDLLSCDVTVVDVVSTFDTIKAWCVRHNIQPDNGVAELRMLADTETAPPAVWVTIEHVEREQAIRLIGELIVDEVLAKDRPVTIENQQTRLASAEKAKQLDLKRSKDAPAAALPTAPTEPDDAATVKAAEQLMARKTTARAASDKQKDAATAPHTDELPAKVAADNAATRFRMETGKPSDQAVPAGVRRQASTAQTRDGRAVPSESTAAEEQKVADVTLKYSVAESLAEQRPVFRVSLSRPALPAVKALTEAAERDDRPVAAGRETRRYAQEGQSRERVSVILQLIQTPEGAGGRGRN